MNTFVYVFYIFLYILVVLLYVADACYILPNVIHLNSLQFHQLIKEEGSEEGLRRCVFD
ncbi:MAG: hypothetical protein ACTSRZ_13995 [Promethearchaeota archaeon]